MPKLIAVGGRTSFDVTFTPDGLGPYSAVIAVTSDARMQPAQIAVEGLVADPSPILSAVVNAASFSTTAKVVVPGSIMTAFGDQFGSRDNLNLFPATKFEGLSVLFNGLEAPMFHAVMAKGRPGVKDQLNVLVPSELPETGDVVVRVRSSVGQSSAMTLRLVSAAPGIFAIADPQLGSRRNAAALVAGTAWLAMPWGMARALKIPDRCRDAGVSPASVCGEPARMGEIVQIYMTGLGRMTLVLPHRCRSSGGWESALRYRGKTPGNGRRDSGGGSFLGPCSGIRGAVSGKRSSSQLYRRRCACEDHDALKRAE